MTAPKPPASEWSANATTEGDNSNLTGEVRSNSDSRGALGHRHHQSPKAVHMVLEGMGSTWYHSIGSSLLVLYCPKTGGGGVVGYVGGW